MLCMIINFTLFIFIPINLFCWIIYRKNLHSDKLAGVERVNTMTAIKNIHSSIPILGLVSGGYSHILAIQVCATGKDMVFKPFTLL